MNKMSDTRSPWWKRVGWLVLIWTCSVVALGLFAYVIKILMNAAGLST
jgi:hypothetical protein